MSPAEFAAHPYAVFHSTHLDPPDMSNPTAVHSWIDENYMGNNDYGNAFHVGTKQSAYERHHVTGYFGVQYENLADEGSRRRWAETLGVQNPKKDATHLVFWHNDPWQTKVSRKDIVHDSDANTPNWSDDRPIGQTQHYRNSAEDIGSVSIAVRDTSELTSQAEFVRKAIREGKEHEVHPETLYHYHQGTLGRTDVDYNTVRDEISRQKEVFSPTYDHPALPGMSLISLHDAGVITQADKNRFERMQDEEHVRLHRKAQFSEGPKVGRINRQKRLDEAEKLEESRNVAFRF